MIPVVVADAASPIALDVIRALGSRGIPVVGVFDAQVGGNYGPIVRASRYMRSAVTVRDGLIAALLELGPQLPKGAVLIPVGDAEMLAISRARDELAPYFRLRMPPPEMIEILLDKSRFAALANERGIPVPVTHRVSDEASLKTAAENVRFPCIIKPTWRDPRWINSHQMIKVLHADNHAELIAAGHAVLYLCGRCLVQEVVPGVETNLYCSFAFLDERSEPVSLSVCRKVRQYPPYFGNTALAESVLQPNIEQITGDICRRLGLVGYVSIEFKREPSTGRWLVLEITPSRVNRQAGVTEIARRSVVAAWYASLAGTPLDRARPRRIGVCWASPATDLLSLRIYLRNHDWTFFEWLWSYRRVRRCEVWSLRDPWPAVVALGSVGRFLTRWSRDPGNRHKKPLG